MNNEKKFYTFRGYQILEQNENNLTPSMEDYLEMIYRDYLKDGYARINKIAEQLNVQAPSVTNVVQKLDKIGMLKYEKYGIVQLTDKGKNVGEFLLNRHITLESFLKKIGVKDSLLKDTEMIEHNISMEALENIELLNQFLEENPNIIKQFDEFKEIYYKNQKDNE
jgi:Mn-dependent DtxR family transcriptional regulator